MKQNKSKYGVADIIHTAEFYDALNTFTTDIPFYLKEAKKARGPVLELCCGTGRITLPLAQAGIDITGIDISSSMLNCAKEKASALGVKNATFHLGDMRKLKLRQKYKLIFIPFNSLQNTYSISDIEKVFLAVRSHLTPDGRFVFVVFNPSLEFIVKSKKLQKGKYKFRLKDGKKVAIDEICTYDVAGQVNRVTWYYRINNQKPIPEKLDMRCFFPQELDALLKYNGFKILKKYGTYDRKQFTGDSARQLYICKRTAE
ncbi:MAG: hypothetical protein A2504_16955 [Bdellovibrionales bacterium RIFOXYD12_FULL_39_22]|nr:MAG: hypothetical protein A2385_05895 [Bdellovibrionales bacterium RIFOXYB1_FULL_39_21]OFZ41485.1 MAG: hypothetical protein A2485_04645 [Bdellovibrionales bacterium RIFOXYC12_FULL_39_17]OFZ50387.1 MAG: hypothetical protein A2404_02475 [Bdellovibrionales bacterium RIFOXYC1_FULL_39_130]OFZ71313.1 MAG: hypothetical protein A2451_10200 [Bdellovibrionales bacterium RIFOXYC2_FULL_39_8]OFZ77666.1 MAG: hypothetical protein A2560_16550 [Bdellovibrionales bacterium RIFOXYD1_FULL_39_84]OFZ92205.1 MAG: